MKTIIASLLVLVSYTNIILCQGIQQKRWVLRNQSIDFTVDPPLLTQGLLGYPTSVGGDGPANSMYDQQGNLLFYIAENGDIFNKYGSPIIGGIQGIGVYGREGEICVVPAVGSSCKYYLFHTKNNYPLDNTDCENISNNTMYYVLDLSLNNNLGEISAPVRLEECRHVTGGVLAVGRLVSGGTKRYLYKVGVNPNSFEVLKFEITASGVGAPTVLYSQPYNQNISYRTVAEADLSHDGTKLAFANNNTGSNANDVTIVHLDPITGNLQSSAGNQGNGTSAFNVSSFADEFTGVEFSPDGSRLFVGQNNVGIHNLTIATGVSSRLTGSDDYGKSHLELAYHPLGQNSIYAVKDDGTALGRIISPNTSTPSFQTAVVNNISAYSYTPWVDCYQLPDQIDGYNYEEL